MWVPLGASIMPSVDVRELGEFGLIERISRWVTEGTRPPADPAHSWGLPSASLSLGIGDDAAAWGAGDTTELWTTDTMVEGVHFLTGKLDWADLGWKVMAANVSDIAAMGGVPRYALVTLGLPGDTLVEAVERLHQGMLAMGNQEGVVIAGGDVVGAPVVFVTIALTGVARGSIMVRSAARAGDLVAISGYPGLSGGGLRLMLEGVQGGSEAEAPLRSAHLRPQPQVALGRRLVMAGVRAAIDTSDGLVDDLAKVCLASGVAARVEQERVPVHPALREVFPDSYWDLVFSGGEEYQLVFTAPPPVMEGVMARERQVVTVIGEVVHGEPGRVVVLDSGGGEVAPRRGGWDHFRL